MQILLASTFRKAAAGMMMVMACSCGYSKAEELSTTVNRLIAEKKYEEALPLAERWVEQAVGEFGEHSPESGAAAHRLAGLHLRLEHYEKAETGFRQVLAIMDSVYGAEHVHVATSLNNLATVLCKTARHEEALSLYRRSLRICENGPGPHHPYTNKVVVMLADALRQTDRFSEARALYRRAVNDAKSATEGTRRVASLRLVALADTEKLLGNYRVAAALYDEALVLLNDHYSGKKDHAELALIQSRAASLRSSLGDYEVAHLLFREATKIFEANGGMGAQGALDHYRRFANHLINSGSIKEAEVLCLRLLGALRSVGDRTGLHAAGNLFNLGRIYRRTGRLAEAEEKFLQALEIQIEVLGERQIGVATTLANLGVLRMDQRRYSEAQEPLERALSIQERLLGWDHRDVILTLHNLGLLHIDLGNPDKALAIARRRAAALQSMLEQMLVFSSERERIAFINNQSAFTLTATLESPVDIANAVLRTRCFVLDSLIEDRRIARQDPTGKLVRYREQLASTKRKLLRERLENSGGNESAGEVPELKKREETLEKLLAGKIEELDGRRSSLPVDALMVSAVLPPGGALVQYVGYGRYLGNGEWKHSYGATVLRRNAAPSFVVCGGSEEIDALIGRYEKSVRGETDEKTLIRESRELYDRLMAPLDGALSGVKQLFVSPEGALSRISFATLLDPDQAFLIENRDVQYIASGRDLLDSRQEDSGNSSVVIIGGPQFSLDLVEESGKPTKDAMVQLDVAEEHFAVMMRDSGDSFDELVFWDLPAAAEGARRIAKIVKETYDEVHLYSGSDATEQSLREFPSPPGILHLATHGFFLDEIAVGGPKPDTHLMPGTNDASGDLRGALKDPMYRSGIALAGAQATVAEWRQGEVPDPDNDGILMAAEVSLLDLRGTHLVVLSACNSGLGGIGANYQGVVGLRRAFAMAGARQLVMTLWPVPDAETASFMEDYYRQLAEGGDYSEAFLKTQRNWLLQLREERGVAVAIGQAGAFVFCRMEGVAE